MKDSNLLIRNIYNEVVPIVLDGIDESLHDIVKQNFLKKLTDDYSQLSINDSNYDILYPDFLNLEKSNWSEFGVGEKLHFLVPDENLGKIIDISSLGYKYAVDKLNNSHVISKDVSDDAINEMKELLNKVEEYNSDLAQWYVSEGSVDYRFASSQTENTSLRVGHLR